MAKESVFDPFALHSPKKESPAGSTGPVFDPFGLAADAFPQDDVSSTASPQPPPELNRLTRSKEAENTLDNIAADDVSQSESAAESISSRKSVVLPPKLLVTFLVHEEVSSVAISGVENEGASDISSDGTLRAQIQSSDATKNAPFALVASTLQGGRIDFRANKDYVSYPSTSQAPSVMPQALHLVNVPKTELGGVVVGNYGLSEQVRHMPLLVERKVTIYSTTCRVAVQIRSKLSNKGDLSDFTIAIALPDHVDADTMEVLRGDGIFDDLKRTVRWTRKELPKGESFMVSAQAKIWSPLSEREQKELRFPVLVRCSSSKDQISSVEFRATEADGHPASVNFLTTKSFRLLHRLP